MLDMLAGESKYGSRKERAHRRKVARQRTLQENPSPWTPPDGESDEEEFKVQPDQTSQITQRERRLSTNGMLVEFAVTYSTLQPDGSWWEVICIDSCDHEQHPQAPPWSRRARDDSMDYWR